MRTLAAIVFFFATLSGCASEGDIGAICDKSGDSSQCVAEALCTKDGSGAGNTCRKRCTEQANCAATEACNGVSGANLKTCQPK